MPEITINSELNAVVFRVDVSPGETVSSGADLIILESMKMEIPVTAPASAEILEILVEVGQMVKEGDPLVRLRAAQNS